MSKRGNIFAKSSVAQIVAVIGDVEIFVEEMHI